MVPVAGLKQLALAPPFMAGLLDLHGDPVPGSVGLGHSRWAAHGKPSERNAHPHRAGRVAGRGTPPNGSLTEPAAR